MEKQECPSEMVLTQSHPGEIGRQLHFTGQAGLTKMGKHEKKAKYWVVIVQRGKVSILSQQAPVLIESIRRSNSIGRQGSLPKVE